jgi:hypothetical protein
MTRLALAVSLVAVGPTWVAAASPEALAAVAGSVTTATRSPVPLADPFPIRRVLVPGDRLPATLKALPPGAVEKLSRAEFEAKVRAATRTAPATAPQLAEAQYTATHGPDGLRGELTWAFLAPPGSPAGPADFPLGTLGLALDAPPTGAVALTAAGPVLRLVGPGPVKLAWSARGRPESGAERFTLAVPPAPLASLELDLPADREPALPPGSAGVELSGMLPDAPTGRQRRRLLFPGGGRVEFVLRPVAGPAGRGAPVLVNRVLRYDLTAGVADFTHEFTLEPVRGLPEELEFTLDPRCQVTAVTTPARLAWSVERTATAVKVRVPCPGDPPKTVTVSGFAALPPSAETGWPLPDARLAGGLPGRDAVEVRCGPAVQWLGCAFGDFRSQPPDTATGGYGFRSGLAAGGGPRALPAPRFRVPAPVFSTADEVTWEAGTPVEPSRVTARFRVTVARGPLASVRLGLSPGYRVVGAERVPRGAPLVVAGDRVELDRPAATGEAFELVVRLAGPRVAPGEAAPFPQAALADAAERDGSYTVVAPPGHNAVATVPPAVTLATPVRLRYPLRGHAPNAAATFLPLTRTLGGTSDTALSVIDGRPCRVTTFRLAATAGPVREVRLRVPVGASVRPETLGAEVEPVLPLEAWAPLLAARGPLAALAAAGAAANADGDRHTVCVTFPDGEAGPVVVRVAAPADGAGDFPPAPSVLNCGLTAAASTPAPVPPTGVRLRDLRRDVSVRAGGRIGVVLSGVLDGSGAADWPLELPPGAEVESVTVAGKSFEPRKVGDELLLPAPCPDTGGDGCPFAVAFVAAGRTPAFFGDLAAPDVGLPAAATPKTSWRLGPGYLRWPRLDAPDATPTSDSAVTLVRAELPAALGWCVALAAAGGAIAAAGRSRRRRLPGSWVVAAAAVELATAGLAPAGWALALRPLTGTLLTLAAIALLTRRRFRRPALALGLALGGFAGAATDGDPETVLLVPTPGGTDVYATRATLDRLAAMARPIAPVVTLTAAEYDGRADGASLARFHATFRLDAPIDAPTTFVLPLAGVRLDALELDGKPAGPTAVPLAPGVTEGYAVTVTGRGSHTLVAEFNVPGTMAVGGREFRFLGPDFPGTRVAFRAPAADVEVVSRRGVQVCEAKGGGASVRAAQGGGAAIVVRARDAAAAMPPVVTVREGHLWDVTDSAAAVESIFQWGVASGSLASVAVDYPDGLEPGEPFVRAATGAAGDALPEVRAVRVTPQAGGRRLTVEFAEPVGGRFALHVRGTPRRPLAARPTLPVPRSLSALATEALVGLRVRGVLLDAVERRGLIDFPADELTRRFGSPAEWQLDRGPPERVFQRPGGSAAELRLTLAPPREAVTVACETRWTLSPAVEIDAQVEVTAPAPVDHVAFEWPASAQLREVRSPALAGWSRAGTRVQVWFTEPTRQAVVTLSGVSKVPPPGQGATLTLGAVHAVTTPASSVLRVRPPAGLRAEWVRQPGVAARPDSSAAETLLTLDAGAAETRVELTALPPPPDPVRVVPTHPAALPVATPSHAAPELPAVEPPASATWSAWPLLSALAAPLALGAVALARRLGLPAPEGLTACGLIGVAVAGPGTPAAWAFAGFALAGLLWRAGKLAGRGWKLVMR